MNDTQISAGVALEAAVRELLRVVDEGVLYILDADAECDFAKSRYIRDLRAALSTPATTGEGEVERVARALCVEAYGRLGDSKGTCWPEFAHLARAALAALPPSSGCASPAIDKPGCVSECPDPDRQSGWEAGAEAMKEVCAVLFDRGAEHITDLRMASPFHSVSQDALLTYAQNLRGWANQIRDTPLPPPPSGEGV